MPDERPGRYPCVRDGVVSRAIGSPPEEVVVLGDSVVYVIRGARPALALSTRELRTVRWGEPMAKTRHRFDFTIDFYGERVCVRTERRDAARASAVAFLGASHCGKTTLAVAAWRREAPLALHPPSRWTRCCTLSKGLAAASCRRLWRLLSRRVS